MSDAMAFADGRIMADKLIEKAGVEALLLVEADPGDRSEVEQRLAKYVRLLRAEDAAVRVKILRKLDPSPELDRVIEMTEAEFAEERSHL